MSGGDPYAAEFREALELATSDFEREVLADGKITDAEYEEAHQRWLSCITELYPPETGMTVALSRDADGLYGYTVSPGVGVDTADGLPENFDRDSDECAIGTKALIAPLYNGVKMNPENLSFDGQVVRCLKSKGLVPDWYTEENLRADIQKTINPPVAYDHSKVTDLDINSEGAADCARNPTR